MVRRVAATSSLREVVGFCTTLTVYPFFRRPLKTPSQPEPSTKPPCTSTIVGRCVAGGVAGGAWPWIGAALAPSASAARSTCCFIAVSFQVSGLLGRAISCSGLSLDTGDIWLSEPLG